MAEVPAASSSPEPAGPDTASADPARPVEFPGAEDGPEPVTPAGRARRHRRFLLFWTVLLLLVGLGYALKLDRHLVAALAILWGLVTPIFTAAFAFLVGILGATPILGPVLVKVITLPIVLLIQGLAFIASLVGVKLGHGRKVFEARVAATILLIGVVIGYILGKLF
jgi:hypothetical protein